MNIIDIPLGDIKPSKTNPRKTFNPVKLQELADSIGQRGEDGKLLGVLQAITVRPNPHDDVSKFAYELVFGERRWRASEIAGMATIRAVVIDIGDTEVLRRQLIENVQRADVHALEEADAYAQLLRFGGYSIEALASETGKAVSTIRGRLKLATGLCDRARKACLEDRISPSVAELLARLPDKKIQDLATREVLGEPVPPADAPHVPASNVHAGIWYESIESDEQRSGLPLPRTTAPLSFRAAQALLHRRFSLRLADARFDTEDAELVKDVPACGPCPHRSGNALDLFPDLGPKAADVCTNPTCFGVKTTAAWDAASAIAEEEGRTVIAGDAAAKLFLHHGGLTYDSKYIDPDAELPYEYRKGGVAHAPSWRKLFGKREVPTVLVQEPGGGPRELVLKEIALETLRLEGKIEKPTKPTGPSSAAKAPGVADAIDKIEAKEAKAKAKAKLEVLTGAFDRAMAGVVDSIGTFVISSDPKTAAGKKTLGLLKWIAMRQIESGGGSYGAADAVVARRGLGDVDPGEALARVIEKARTAGEVLALMVELQIAGDAGAIAAGCKPSDYLDEALALAGVEWAKCKDLAKASLEAEAKVTKRAGAK